MKEGKEMTAMQAARKALSEVFGYDSFRPGQEDVVAAILSGRDVMAVMPTGAGKSLCYQIPALVLPGITLVVSPLISLMRDQVSALIQNGVRAAYLNSSLSARQHALALDNARRGVYKIIYVAPERLLTESFLAFAQQAQIAQVVVDEAHCVSQWGQDFRPGYLDIEPFIRALPVRPRVSAFTATATQTVRKDVMRLIALDCPYEITTGFDRPNLYFEVRRGGDRDSELLRFLGEHRGQSGVVYCGTRKGVEEVAKMLVENGVDAVGYHAGMGDEERALAQEDFVADRAPVIVATNAFGMGIDKSNVSFVVHYNMPKDLESYYQEAGRAGRDGEDAVCCLLYQPSDVRLNVFLIEHAQESSQLDEETKLIVTERAKERLKQMTFYATGSGCLRARILSYFGEQPQSTHCGNCSSCLTQSRERDVTREAGKIVSGVMVLQGKYGKALAAKVFAGVKDERIRAKGLDKLTVFGCLKEESEDNIREMIDELIAYEVLETTDGQYPLLKPGPRAREALLGDEPIRMTLHARGETAREKRVSMKPVVDKGLFGRLTALRRRIAEEQHVPPFIIFTNATLRDMAVKRPRNRREMLRVAGVGEGKMERYGDAFLREIERYISD
ncbi:MAG: DNA helicase RecQ [Clostridia bacterium]|nr:DNA helicase RecQ [Clostridia bacterium]